MKRPTTAVRPKKFLGQHFLRDEEIAARIAATLDDYRDLPVLEIGPGMGVLTRPLIARGHNLTVIEIDGESVAYLQKHFPELEGKILAEDFLRCNLDTLFGSPFCVIGNYPYNISSQIFFKVLDHKDSVPCCSGMIQKEVAERLASPPGNKSYGILSVLLQAWYDIEYLFTVDEHVFEPPPKVKSAVIRMTRNSRRELPCNEALFKRVVKTAFNQRRKTMRNSLASIIAKEAMTHPSFARRPEELSVDDFIELTRLIEPHVLPQAGQEK